MKSIATYALTFFGYIVSVLAIAWINVSVHYIAKEPAFYMAGYFVLDKILLPDSIGQAGFLFGFFLIIFEQFNYKNIPQRWKTDSLRRKIKTSFEKFKENWKN